MKKIFRYPIEVTNINRVLMPEGAQILKVAIKDDQLSVWALVDEMSPDEWQTFYVFGTGHDIFEPIGQYIDSVLDGRFVWHVFREAGYH